MVINKKVMAVKMEIASAFIQFDIPCKELCSII